MRTISTGVLTSPTSQLVCHTEGIARGYAGRSGSALSDAILAQAKDKPHKAIPLTFAGESLTIISRTGGESRLV